VIDGTELFDDRLQEWGDFHNFNRSHGAPGRICSRRRRSPDPEQVPRLWSRSYSNHAPIMATVKIRRPKTKPAAVGGAPLML
jgi:hypothetical protein